MKRDDERAFGDYVAVRLEQLRRTAYLYCRDWHLADDLVGVTVGKLYVHWRRAQAADNVDAYVHGILIHAGWTNDADRGGASSRSARSRTHRFPVPRGIAVT